MAGKGDTTSLWWDECVQSSSTVTACTCWWMWAGHQNCKAGMRDTVYPHCWLACHAQMLPSVVAGLLVVVNN